MGCAKKLSPSSYLNYLNENSKDFLIEKQGAVKYRLSYITAEQILAENYDASKKDEAKNEIKKMKENPISMFSLHINVDSGNLFSQNSASRSEQMEYYSLEFKKQIYAVTQNLDTVGCQGYIFQAGAGFGPNSHFEFYFPHKISEIKEVIIHSNYLEDKTMHLDVSSLHRDYPELRIK